MQMQKNFYARIASQSRYDAAVKNDSVVGSYHQHDEWSDYDRFLMRFVDKSFGNKLALDFGCGPGRNIVRYHHLFRRIDGCDIAPENLENARTNLKFHGVPEPNLYVTSGNDLGAASSNSYDFIFSTICMQHICVHRIRYEIFSHMYRALRKGGRISIQMGFGNSASQTVGYFDNFTAAQSTNRGCDTRVEDADQLENDLYQLHFKEFDYWVRPVGPGDSHPYWIFFTAVK